MYKRQVHDTGVETRLRGTEQERRDAARARLEASVGDLGGRRVVLLAPTWRDGAADPVVPTPAEWAAVESWLAAHDAVLVVRPHPLAVGDWSHRSDAVRLLDSALEPEVMRVLETQGPGAGGEVQLTDAMAQMIGSQPFHAVTFAGRRFDCGSKLGFVEATLALALEREDIGAEVRKVAERLLAQ